MVNKSSVRRSNEARFRRCIDLRKLGYSYSEIRRSVSVSKSTLQNWLTLAGLTLTEDHLLIQSRKRRENWKGVGIEASRQVRIVRNKEKVEDFVRHAQKWYREPLFLLGVMAYEAEGSKTKGTCKFSNSDYRMIILFVSFVEKYFEMDKEINLKYRLFVHESRSGDLERIRNYWSSKLGIPLSKISLTWKRNKVVRIRRNKDYFGQMVASVVGVRLITRKILAVSDIIMRQYCGVV